jgi:iron complex transport system permease protein
MKLRFSLIVIALNIAVVASLLLGATQVENIWRYLFNPGFDSASTNHLILWQIRIPRILVALLIGAALGLAGAIAQSAANNPLADPAILGTSAGASLGVVIGVLLNFAEVGSVLAVLFATVGALIATALTFTWARSVGALIIIGIGTSALFSAVVGLLITATNNPEIRSISFWSLGSLALATSESLLIITPVFLVCFFFAFKIAPQLDLLSLGDISVRHLGLSAKAIRLKAFLIIGLLVAVSVSTVGSISFLALAAPHIARILFGGKNRVLTIASSLIGALILLVGDTIARSVLPPYELPIGLITSLLGAPILILLVRKAALTWK